MSGFVPDPKKSQSDNVRNALKKFGKDLNKLDKSKMRTAAGHPEGALHRAADRHLRKVYLAVQYAFAKARQAANEKRITKSKSFSDAMLAVDPIVSELDKALRDKLPDVLRNVLIAGGQTTAAKISVDTRRRAAEVKTLAPKLGMRFDLSNPEIQSWIDEHAGELITGISKTTRERIHDAISDGFENEDPSAMFDDILDAIGDSSRAEMIARTEIMTAANEGQRQAWGQAVDEGLLSPDSQRVWIATDGCCDECDALDGQTADLDGEYEDGVDGPPLHPNCRCTEGITGG
jgi:hypothetical protein